MKKRGFFLVAFRGPFKKVRLFGTRAGGSEWLREPG